MSEIKYGIIEEGSLQGRKIILEPRNDSLHQCEYLVEEGLFFNGSPMFALYCLVNECKIPHTGCPFREDENHK